MNAWFIPSKLLVLGGMVVGLAAGLELLVELELKTEELGRNEEEVVGGLVTTEDVVGGGGGLEVVVGGGGGGRVVVVAGGGDAPTKSH
jgi:hypothetical protein